MTNQDPEFTQWFSDIDFELLNHLWDQLAKQCGVDPKRLRHFTLDDVYDLDTKDGSPLDKITGGKYNSRTNTIGLNFKLITQKPGLDETDKRLMILHSFIHEWTHGISYHDVQGDQERKGLYQADFFTDDLILLEEALTEQIARELTLHYIGASGLMPLEQAKIKLEKFIGYHNDIFVFNKLVDYLAKQCGVSPKTVTEAFMREKISGELGHELSYFWYEFLSDLLPPDKFKELYIALTSATPVNEANFHSLEKVLDRLATKPRPKLLDRIKLWGRR